MERNIFELAKRDERVNIKHHVTVFFILGTDEQGVLRKDAGLSCCFLRGHSRASRTGM